MLHAHCLIYTAFNFELCKPWKKLMKEKSFVMAKTLNQQKWKYEFYTILANVICFEKKNTIVKRKNIEIIFWSSTKPFAFTL